jgi:hypothetical protein
VGAERAESPRCRQADSVGIRLLAADRFGDLDLPHRVLVLVAQTHVGDAVGTPPEDADQRQLRTADTGTRFGKHVHISHQLIIPPPDCQSAAERTRRGPFCRIGSGRKDWSAWLPTVPARWRFRRALAECMTLGGVALWFRSTSSGPLTAVTGRSAG